MCMNNNGFRIKNVLLIIILCLSYLSCQKLSSEGIDFYSKDPLIDLRLWMDTLCSKTFTGRKVGTPGNKKTAHFLFNELLKRGYLPEIQEFVHTSGDTLRNIIIQKDGLMDSLIIIGAHYDGQTESNNKVHFEAANDNASGVVTLLSVMDSISRIDTKYAIRAVFFDGEEGCVPPAFKGSSYYVNSLIEKEKTILYINLDAMGHDHDDQMKLGWYGSERTYSMVDQLNNEQEFKYTLLERAKGEGGSDYRSFSLENISCIFFTDITLVCDHPQHNVGDTKDAVSLSRLARVKNIVIKICNSF